MSPNFEVRTYMYIYTSFQRVQRLLEGVYVGERFLTLAGFEDSLTRRSMLTDLIYLGANQLY